MKKAPSSDKDNGMKDKDDKKKKGKGKKGKNPFANLIKKGK
jgi:hypothetical protein